MSDRLPRQSLHAYARPVDLTTAENECKWVNIEPQRNQFSYTQCDYIANTFLGNGSTWRLHKVRAGRATSSDCALVNSLPVAVPFHALQMCWVRRIRRCLGVPWSW